jgi:hypothetical protein
MTDNPPKRPAHWREHHGTGLEGSEALLGRSINMVFKTLSQKLPYQHEVNDALVLLHITALQFAKNQGLVSEYVAHDRDTMKPINQRMGKLIAETGNKELALEAVFDITECHYQLVLDTRIEPGKRTWTSPFRKSLAACNRTGQSDMTETEIHEIFTRPRLLGYAEDMGVEFVVSDLAEDGTVVCEVR